MSTASATATVIPIGTIVTSAINQDPAPNGWIICDGRVIPSQYTELIAAIGANTPNLVGRILIGAGTLPWTGKQSDGSTPNFDPIMSWPLGSTGGEYTHKLTVAEMPSHNHSLQYTFDLNSGCHDGSNSTPCQTQTVRMTNATGGDTPHNNVQPFYAVNYIIYGGPY